MKHIYIVYNPGYAGNFLQKLFSIEETVAPALLREELHTTFANMSTTDRVCKYKFEAAHSDWQRYHRQWADMYEYLDISKTLSGHTFNHIVFAMHEVEHSLFKNMKITDPDYTPITMPRDAMFFGVELNLHKYGTWIKNAQQSLKFMYRLEEKKHYDQFMRSLPKDMRIDLTQMLDSYDGFCEEYERVCSIMGITADIDNATTLYHDWYDTRVACFLH